MENKFWNAHMEVRTEIEKNLGWSTFKYVSSKTEGSFAAVVYCHEYAECYAPCKWRYARHDILFAINLSEKPQWTQVDERHSDSRSFRIISVSEAAIEYSEHGEHKTYKFKEGV